jgi:alpha-amylase
MKKLFALMLLLIGAYSSAFCQTNQTIDGHPAWIMQGNIYEVNVRQYTKEGTFKAFEKHLDRLKEMGVQTLWFMPINPISKVDRKGSLGSYYAVSDYTAINPEFGNLRDFKNLVNEAHKMGMKVIIDWVPNHTGADHVWIKKHPDFYVKDKNGKPAVAYDWADTRQLNYKNKVMQDSMINAMKYWLVNTNIDGFRCDVAWNVPGDFWKRCITTLRQGRNLFFLAEGDKTYLHPSGFDATYPWEMFHTMGLVAKGVRPATSLDTIKAKYDKVYPKNALELYFTSNHDENSWNKADFGIFPGASHAPFAVFTQTMPHSVPLIYGGQEEPVLRAIKFFDKDNMKLGSYGRAKFYKTLLNLRKFNPALASNASFRKVTVGDNKAVYAYVREMGDKKVLVILNLSPHEQMITIEDDTLLGTAHNVFSRQDEPLTNKPWKMAPWGYAVFTY